MMIFMDGFDHLTSGQMGRKWDRAANATTTGAFGVGQAINTQSGGLTKTLPANYVTAFCSGHYYSGTLSGEILLQWKDGASSQLELRRDGTGALFFTRNGTSIGSVSTPRMVANTWYYIVCKITINGSTGVAEVKVGNVSWLTGASLNTQATGNAFFSQITVVADNNGTLWDNFCLWDTTAGDITGYPSGEIVIDTKFPTGAGADTQWTPSAGSNYQNVDDPTPNDDTDYNSSATPGQIDDFAVGNLAATSGTVITVAVNSMDRIDDATPHTVSHHVKSSSATADSTAFSSSSTYNNHQSFFPVDPNTSAAWTISARNAANFGYKLVT